MLQDARLGQIRQLAGANTYRKVLHEVEQYVDLVVRTLRRLFFQKLSHAITHYQRLIHVQKQTKNHTARRRGIASAKVLSA